MKHTIRFTALVCVLTVLFGLCAEAVDYNEARRADKFEVSDNEAILFEFDDEDYEPDEEGWFILGGKWEAEDGCLEQKRDFTGYNDKQMNYYGKTFGDFTAVVRFKVTEVTGASQGWFALAFRRTQYDHEHEESGYIITVEGPKSDGRTVLCDWTQSKSFSEYGVNIDVNDYVDMVLVAKGNTYTFYFNDAIETGDYDFRVTDDAWTEPGFIGLCAGNSLISVDYLRIYTGDKQEGIVPELQLTDDAATLRFISAPSGSGRNVYALYAAAFGALSLLFCCAMFLIGGRKREK